MMRKQMCRWCGRQRGILKGLLICFSCDYAQGVHGLCGPPTPETGQR